MLRSLSIENIAVIEKSSIDFEGGLNVLTGETGAGKSIVIDAINAVLGERTSRDLVRNGTPGAAVTALFQEVNQDVAHALEKMGIESEEDNSLLISRKISADGKNVCKINGKNVTVSMLRDIGKRLINIHGQHDSQELLNAEFHYKYIDMLLEDGEVLSKYSDKFRELILLRRKIKALTTDEEEKNKKIEILKYQIEELEAADIKSGEKERLLKRREVIENSENILSSLNSAYDALNGSEEFSGAYLLMNEVCEHISAASKYDEDLIVSIKKMYDTLYSLEEYKDLIREKLDRIEFDPNELEAIEERLDLLSRLSSKYGSDETAMLDFLADAKQRLNAVIFADEELEKLSAEYERLLEETVLLAERLSGARKKAARLFEKNVKAELTYLDMPDVAFLVQFERGKLSLNGYDTICFMISTNPGEPAKPIGKIASGGELSRIMLAVKNIIARSDSVATLIFDEVDTGVSGSASQKIGLKLKTVSRDCQILCVTHSAQIAAAADHQFLISKRVAHGRTYTDVRPLDFNERKNEIARIIGGLNITDTILKSAEELLKQGGQS